MNKINLSVIVVSFNAPTLLETCLAALHQQTFREGVEILVVRDWETHPNHKEKLLASFANVKWIDAPENCTIPKMRRLGLNHSQGEIIALLEDDCVVSEIWCQSVLLAHRSPEIAIGGPIEPGNYFKALDWGVYFCEYVRFMQPFSGSVAALPGNNVSYKRTALEKLLLSYGETDEFYDVFFHQTLQQEGQELKADPALVVHNVNTWKFAHISRVPFHHGRGFAGMRFVKHARWKRGLFLGVALVLPLIQVSRIVREVLSRQRYAFKLAQALPEVMLFSMSWSVGEFVGYLLGPGDSLQQWR